MPYSEPEILTVSDLAELLSCDAETVAAKLINGDLPGLKIGRSWIIPKQAFLQRLNSKALEDSAARREDKKTMSTNSKKQTLERDKNIEFTGNSSAFSPRSTTKGRRRRPHPELPDLI
jgi:excisionase family DNA binding protein